MSVVNFANKELTLKIVYYGPGLGGKTTNLRSLHKKLNPTSCSKMLSLATATDRTLFFDFLPLSLGKINGYAVKIQLYTVPGQVYYNATRKLVLRGADAVVFVASSQKGMRQENIDSLKNMWENLSSNNLDPETIPTVIQYNKRDLPDIDTMGELNSYLNFKKYPYTEGIAIEGIGVKETFKLVTKLLLSDVHKKYQNGPARTSNHMKKDIQDSPDEKAPYQQIPPLTKDKSLLNPSNQNTSLKVQRQDAHIPEKENQAQLTKSSSPTSQEPKKKKRGFLLIFIGFIKKLTGKGLKKTSS
jgi:signal recognition particle receptor subunit beta